VLVWDKSGSFNYQFFPHRAIFALLERDRELRVMKSIQMWRTLIAVAIMFIPSSCGSAGGSSSTAQNVEGQRKPSSSANALKLGVNVNYLEGGSRVFMNLIYGSSWRMQNTNPWGGYEDVPATSLDDNGWVKSVPPGYRVIRTLSVPLSGGTFVCRYSGNGTLDVSGPSVSNVITSAGATKFTLSATYPNPQAATLDYKVDSTNYIRNVDCRESNAAGASSLAPEFLSALSTFKTIRFMKWQVATEANTPVTWATRNKPGDGDYGKNDGVPVETLVDSANQAGTDLWVTVPWNADNDYITKFSTYVRDNLASGHAVYVEVSNEVWNDNSKVGAQAAQEARSEGLPSATGSGVGSNLERYAEKTEQVMAIWSSVFTSQANRLVRVAALQHVTPNSSDLLLKYMKLSKSVDALATAPYFGYEITDTMSLDQIFGALTDEVTNSVNQGLQQKAVAQKYGLRYLTYEAGQTVVLPNSLTLEQQIERDPRMYDVYQQFMTDWQSKVGDGLNLFALDGEIGQYGGWGLSEYVGQPDSRAPKLRAVNAFLSVKRQLN
jgi:hypothetical protein